LIEASANIEWCVCVCGDERATVLVRSVPPSSFYRLKEVGLHAWGLVRSSTSPPVVRGRTIGLPCHRALWGMAQVVVIILANPSAHARSASLSCGASQRRGDRCRSAPKPTSDEVRRRGCRRPNLAPVKRRAAFEGRRPCPLKVLRRGKVQGVGDTVAGGVRQVHTWLHSPAPRWE